MLYNAAHLPVWIPIQEYLESSKMEEFMYQPDLTASSEGEAHSTTNTKTDNNHNRGSGWGVWYSLLIKNLAHYSSH